MSNLLATKSNEVLQLSDIITERSTFTTLWKKSVEDRSDHFLENKWLQMNSKSSYNPK